MATITSSPRLRSACRALETAAEYIAPTWPLDKLIAVNPFWELRHLPASEVAARVAALAQGRPLMSARFYAEMTDPPILDYHLVEAASELGIDATIESLRTLPDDEDDAPHWHNVSDLLDKQRDPVHEMPWRDEIIHQVSQYCAAYFLGEEPAAEGTLYANWLDTTRADHGIPIVMGEPALRQQFARLPDDRDELLLTACEELDLRDDAADLYAHALLLDVNGWASWAAYLRWQARLEGGDLSLVNDLLAIRLAWDLALWRHARTSSATDSRQLENLWKRQLRASAPLLEDNRNGQRTAWMWQRAAELAYQEDLYGRVAEPRRINASDTPEIQAVFCIDVRSEVIRRHLEAQDPRVETRGFAGFFGLPLQLEIAQTGETRPQLPGLLSPSLKVSAHPRSSSLTATRVKGQWSKLGDSPPSMFGLVEASGPLYALRLLKDSFFPGQRENPVNGMVTGEALELSRDGEALSVSDRSELAAGVLHAMGVERNFARFVLLVGHGSSTANNPHAASLDCGACGGQAGDLNARVLAGLLNDPDVREDLGGRGICIPDSTRFIAALHDTTTDDIRIVDDSDTLSAEVSQWLSRASAAARRERATRLDIEVRDDKQLAHSLRRRARDWSQVRPEWGLAGNAAFIAAPRRRTRGANLEGRVFLHDYDWHEDPDFSVLELIMTAPMVVAHWINMQYNASVTDNRLYGSGNKVLHNVVGGSLGVFEGNGGDLRIGLPMQSVHDGTRFMHTPLRLSVFLDAPAEAIFDIYKRTDVVRQLVDNDWLYLNRFDDEFSYSRLYQDQWFEPRLVYAA